MASLTQMMPPEGVPSPQATQQPASQGNPLAALLGPQQQQQRAAPVPTAAQTAAAIHHFAEIKSAFKPIMDDPNLGKVNIRPKLLDSMSKLLATQTLSLPEVMNAVKALPDDPTEQVKFVQKIYTDNDMAQKMVLEQHRNAPMPGEDSPEDPYSQDNHGSMMEALMKQYKQG